MSDQPSKPVDPAPNNKARKQLLVAPYPSELQIIEDAASAAGQPPEVFVLNAALSAAQKQAPPSYTPHQLMH